MWTAFRLIVDSYELKQTVSRKLGQQNFENLGPDGTIRTGPDQVQEKIESPGPNGPWIPDGHMTDI